MPLTKDSLQTVFVHVTRALAKRRPIVVLIEDLHFAPEDGRALFASLALAAPDHRILLIGTARPGLPEEWLARLERLEHTSRVGLERLGPKDLGKLLVDAFRSERLAEELGFRIATKSDGNPFFVFEIIRGLREGRFIKRRPDGTWVTTKVIEEIAIPSSVQDLIQARIADLDDEDRNLLEVASCCGFEFDGRLPGEVLGLNRIPALQRLGRLEKTRLIRASGPGFVFDHHQLQESIHTGIAQALCEEYHAAIGEVLEKREAAAGRSLEAAAGPTALALTEHFLQGAAGERAHHYLDAALNHLVSGHRNEQAIALTGRALADPDVVQGAARVELQLRRAELLDLLGRRAEEGEVLEEAAVAAEATGEASLRAKAHRALGAHHWSLSRHDEAREELERAFKLARESGDRGEVAKIAGNLGNVAYSLGRFDEAKEHYGRFLEISREIGDRPGEGRARANLGTVLWSHGSYEEAREHYEGRLAIAREIGDRLGEARGTGSLGNVFFSLGRYEKAREHYERSLTTAREIGDRRWEGVATGNLGLVFLALGRYEEARERYERWVEIAGEIGDRRGQASATVNLGSVFECLGRYVDASEQHKRGLEIAREIGDRRGEATALVDLGSLCVNLGDSLLARMVMMESLTIFREIGARREEALALQRLGRVAEEAADVEEASRLIEEALALRREIRNASGIAESLLGLGGLRAAQGREDEARAHLAEALEMGRELDLPDSRTGKTFRRSSCPAATRRRRSRRSRSKGPVWASPCGWRPASSSGRPRETTATSRRPTASYAISGITPPRSTGR